jgi:hypothetical protein
VWVLPGALAIACLVFWWEGGFLSGSDVQARLAVATNAPSAISDVRLVAGGDKKWWPTVSPGESVRTALRTGGGDTQLLVQFTLRGERIQWRGPALGEDAGYRIAVEVDRDGAVSERHCKLPCLRP